MNSTLIVVLILVVPVLCLTVLIVDAYLTTEQLEQFVETADTLDYLDWDVDEDGLFDEDI